MKTLYTTILACLLISIGDFQAQQFVNGGLDGDASWTSNEPDFWFPVLYTDPISTAGTGADSPDLCDSEGPNSDLGIHGLAFEGQTFLGGSYYSQDGDFNIHEGIQQLVLGFEVDQQYVVIWHQCVQKHFWARDTGGTWRVYANGELMGEALICHSFEDWAEPDDPWFERHLSFFAEDAEILFQFLPWDPDGNILYDSDALTYDGVHMGIDDIYIHVCEDFVPNIVLVENELMYTDTTILHPAWVDCETGDVVEFDEDYNLTQSGTYQLTGEYSWCQFESPCVEYTFVSVEEISKSNALVYPNPATDWLNVELSNTSTGLACLLTSDGRLILSTDIYKGKNQIDLTDIAPGSYFLEITADGLRQIESVVVR
jgi:hypothetical protein